MIVIGIILASVALLTNAQDIETDQETLCGEDRYQVFADFLIRAADDIRESEEPDMLVLELQSAIASWRLLCDGYTFTSDEYGLDAVTDVITFHDGVYKMRLESTSSFDVDITVLSGRCGDTFAYVSSSGGVSESVSVMEGCVALIDFSGDEEWTLAYEPVYTGE
jgi:hypothetical protein